jgi:hypothetical protein
MGTECDRPPSRTLLVPWRPALVLPGAGEIQPAHQENEADPQQPAGSEESKDINAVQRLYTRLPRSFRSFIARSSISTKPVSRPLFFRSAHFSFTAPLNIHSPPARIRPRIIVTGKLGSFPSSLLDQTRWNVTGEESPTG